MTPRLASPIVCRIADALHPARDQQRLDLDHEVDRAHVDAELERRGGDQPRMTALRRSSTRSVRPRDRTVVCAPPASRRRASLTHSPPLGDAPLLTKIDLERCTMIGSTSAVFAVQIVVGTNPLSWACSGCPRSRRCGPCPRPALRWSGQTVLLRGVDDGDSSRAQALLLRVSPASPEIDHLVERRCMAEEADALEQYGVRPADRFEPLSEAEVSATLSSNQRINSWIVTVSTERARRRRSTSRRYSDSAS